MTSLTIAFLIFLIAVAYMYMLVSQKIVKILFALISIYILMLPLLTFLKFDYIALILVLLYIGAVAVFFLFVLMTTKIIEKNPSLDQFTNELINYQKKTTDAYTTRQASDFPTNQVGRFPTKSLSFSNHHRYVHIFFLGFLAFFFTFSVCINLNPLLLNSLESINLFQGFHNHAHLFFYSNYLIDNLSNISIIASTLFFDFAIELILLSLLLFAAAIGAMFFTS